MRNVVELVEGYGLWFLLGAVFLIMHWFGMSCCGSRRWKNRSRIHTIMNSQDHTSD
jgi:hypothetical protein